ncbi:proline--tRNA ligase [bacterium]|nr:proline--tRNA ligase [bacterium]
MKRSQYFIPTQKEDPQDAEIVSHKIMVRGGYIRKLAAGVYTLLPLGIKIQKKIEKIIRKHMDKIGFHEIFMPILSPSELWKESGRWDVYGKEMMRIKDRHDRDFVLGPTHEEIVTEIVRKNVKSYKELPMCLYQIQTKFRDEIRPRFGVMRGREFTMKDAYSFDATEEGAIETYTKAEKAYNNIFTDLQLEYSEVEAQSGPIGGSTSKEFMVHAKSGEDLILACKCGYAANVEKAAGIVENPSEDMKDMSAVDTPNVKTVEEVADFLDTPKEKIVKTILLQVKGKILGFLIRGDREINLDKLRSFFRTDDIDLALEDDIVKATDAPIGFAGPVGLKVEKLFADTSVEGMSNFVVGGNKTDTHLKNVNLERDVQVAKFIDCAYCQEGDKCPKCEELLSSFRGIEVGHIFVLGTKYSKSMNAKFLDENGKSLPFQMGCYGIGVGRTMAAVIEQKYNKENGMYWPMKIAPFHVEILPLNVKDDKVRGKAEELYKKLISMNYDVIIDDRDLNAGIKFAESDLLGVPYRVVVGRKFLESGKLELLNRSTSQKSDIDEDKLFENIPRA